MKKEAVLDFDLKKWKFTDESDELQTKKGPNSNDYVFNNNSHNFNAQCYEAFPYMFLCFFDISASEISANNNSNHRNLIQFNYCVEGRIELGLEDGFNVCLQEADFCLSKEVSKTPFFFPTKNYKGITIYFDEENFRLENAGLLSTFELDFQNLHKKYLSSQSTIIMPSSKELCNVMASLWENKENLSNFRLKQSTLEIINILLNHTDKHNEKRAYHTKTQAEIAKKAEKLLTEHLAEHIPIKKIAIKFGISETSLKNYFKAIYGENISEYLRKYRMKKASQLLLETKLSVGEISHLVGYTKQGKFAELFRRYYGHSPLEYRRANHLGNENHSNL